MKKKFAKIKLAFQKYFLVLLLTGISGYLNAQTIDIDAACPNNPFTLEEQEVGTPISTAGTWAIPLIGAIGGGGGVITMSITSIDVTAPFSFNRCSSCNSSETFEGITFRIINGGTNFEITGTPTGDIVGWTYSVTITAATNVKSCSRTFSFNIVASGSHSGEPHVTTVDGGRYDFQSIGEFVLLKGDSSENFEIQTRQTPYATQSPGDYSNIGLSTCVSINTAVAARVGKHRVTYQPNINGQPDPSGMQLRLDGKLTELGDNGFDLGSGGRIVKLPTGNGIEIDFPNGTSLVATATWLSNHNVWFLNLDVHRTKATKGILGVMATNKTEPGLVTSYIPAKTKSWLPALPDGSSLGIRPTDKHERFIQLYTTFANAWRVTDQTSLFDYAPGTSTATFTDKNWPMENAQSCSIPGQTPLTPIPLAKAQELCRDIIDSSMRAEAIFDVMITGDPTFAKAYLLSQQIQTSTTETTVKASKDTTKYKEPVTFTANVYRKYSAGKDVLAGSVEFNVDGKKFGQVKLEENGRAILTIESLEVGQHKIAAKFIPDSESTAFSSSSLEVTHTVLDKGGIFDIILHQWWFWLIVIIVIIILYFVSKKKKNH